MGRVIGFHNFLNTIVSYLKNENTVQRTYTFRDRDGTIVDDVDFQWTNYVPVWTGFSVDPTVGYARYLKIGKTCIVTVFCTANGTSSSTATTVTLPFAASSDVVQVGLIVALANNGSVQTTPGFLVTRVGSNVADLYINAAAGAWTAGSTGKRASFTLIYHTT